MLRLPEFTYVAPKTLDEACRLLAEHADQTTILAGGTDVVPALKNGLAKPQYIMDLGKISALRIIQHNGNDAITLGPLASLTTVENTPVVAERFPGLSCAAGLVGAKQLRNRGTIGGNIALHPRCIYYNQPGFWMRTLGPCLKRGGEVCHAVKGSPVCRAYCAADTVPVLVALNASITITSTEGSRRCALKDLYTGDGRRPHKLKPTEIISEITLPLPQKQDDAVQTSVYRKLRLRKAIDFPLVGVAVRVTVKASHCEDLSVVLGAVDPTPVVVDNVTTIFRGKTMTPELIDQAGALARQAARPVANGATSPGYRRDMAAVLTKRCLADAAKNLGIMG